MRDMRKYISGTILLIVPGLLIGWISGNIIGFGLLLNTLIMFLICEVTDLYKDKYPYDRVTYYVSPYIKSFLLHLLLIAAVPGLNIYSNGTILINAAVIFISYTLQFILFAAFANKKNCEDRIPSIENLDKSPKEIIITMPTLDKLTDGINEIEKRLLPELLMGKMIKYNDTLRNDRSDKKYLHYEDSINTKNRSLDESIEKLRDEIRDYGVLVIKYIPGTKTHLKKGKHLIIPRTELWGRLHYCGFEIIGEVSNEGITLVAAVKVAFPLSRPRPSKSIIISLERIGYRGYTFKAVKLRSMYPYSEFIQKKVFDINNFGTAGKINNDFRITPIGRILRKYWIDEIPQIINWLKSDIKLVGIRGMSRHYFSLYPKDYRELFIKVKPGLIPPIFDDSQAGDFSRIVETEKKYLETYLNAPLRTDIKCLFDTLHKILFKGIRSA